jgi:adenine-specific DNA-methyltransferase
MSPTAPLQDPALKGLASTVPGISVKHPRNYMTTAKSKRQRTAGGGDQLTPESRRWLAETPLEHRKALGQYMTPRDIRERLLDLVPIRAGDRVLDPGVGTGEFLRSVLDRESEIEAVGWDVDPFIVKPALALVPEAQIVVRSALDEYDGPGFDVVLGNPPYFQFQADRATRTRFADVISGRPNIFALFFQAGLSALKNGGRLAFVVPTSMNNGAYFESLRQYILREGAIEHLEMVGDHFAFDDAQAPVQLIVIQKGAKSDRYVFRREVPEARLRRTVFTTDVDLMASHYQDRLTLWEAGYEAVTGTVVWNQAKDRLRAEPGEDRQTIPLIWATHITDQGAIDFGASSPTRPGHVVGAAPLLGPAILVNRIVGMVGGGHLRAGLVPAGMLFVGENHVNVIRARTDARQKVGWAELLALLLSNGVGGRVRALTGNTQLSATELTHLLPLDVLPTEPAVSRRGSSRS